MISDFRNHFYFIKTHGGCEKTGKLEFSCSMLLKTKLIEAVTKDDIFKTKIASLKEQRFSNEKLLDDREAGIRLLLDFN